MEIKRVVEKNGLIVSHFSGVQSFQDAVDAISELTKINKYRGIFEIVIHEDLILDFEKEKEQDLAITLKETFDQFDYGALAIVSDDDFVFAISRMVSAYIDMHIEVAVFRSEDLAREWMDRKMSIFNNED
jgi:hypothetical protein